MDSCTCSRWVQGGYRHKNKGGGGGGGGGGSHRALIMLKVATQPASMHIRIRSLCMYYGGLCVAVILSNV